MINKKVKDLKKKLVYKRSRLNKLVNQFIELSLLSEQPIQKEYNKFGQPKKIYKYDKFKLYTAFKKLKAVDKFKLFDKFHMLKKPAKFNKANSLNGKLIFNFRPKLIYKFIFKLIYELKKVDEEAKLKKFNEIKLLKSFAEAFYKFNISKKSNKNFKRLNKLTKPSKLIKFKKISKVNNYQLNKLDNIKSFSTSSHTKYIKNQKELYYKYIFVDSSKLKNKQKKNMASFLRNFLLYTSLNKANFFVKKKISLKKNKHFIKFFFYKTNAKAKKPYDLYVQSLKDKFKDKFDEKRVKP
jgi:hypothetical protein